MANQSTGGRSNPDTRAEGGESIADGGDAIPPSPIANRATTDYSIYPDPSRRDIETITVAEDEVVEDTAASSTRQYVIIEELFDRLICSRWDAIEQEIFTEEGELEQVFVAKPQNSRRSIWENRTINFIKYTYPDAENHSLRIAVRVDENGVPLEDAEVNPPVYQRYVNPYLLYEETPTAPNDPDFHGSIIYVSESLDDTGLATNLIDSNYDARQWAVERPLTEAEQEALAP